MNRLPPAFRILLVSLAVFALLAAVSCGNPPPPVKTRISLNTEPEGAVVSIRGIERGKTPLKGSMKPGTYLLKFSLPGYKNKWQKIELTQGEQKQILVKLEPETAAVMITSVPDAAAVTFQGRKLGKTPLVIPNLPHGDYSAELSRHGYNKQTASWTVNSAIPVLVKINLSSNLGTLSITSRPSNAAVLLDGKPAGRTPFQESVEEGKHTVELRRQGYISQKKTVLIRSGSVFTIPTIHMEVKSGSIRVTSKPSGARITIAGKQYGDTPVQISNLKPGTYTIQLEKAGYDPAERTVNLPPGENLDLMLNLDSNTGGADIITQPAGLTVYLDGKMIGITEKNPNNKNSSKIFPIRNLSMGKHQITIAHKRAKPEKKKFTFSVEKGKIVRLTGLNLWIPNAVIFRTDGTVETGRITQNLPGKYEFEPSPGVKYTIEKTTVKKIDYLPETE